MAATNPKKRPRERTTADSDLFAIYEDLASENNDVRIKAATDLTRRFEATTDAEILDPVLKRLVKGICSSRKGARLGFSIALTEFLAQHAGRRAEFSPYHILDLAEQLTRPPGDAAAQEARDYYIGRLFVADAIIISGVLLISDDDAAGKWQRLLDLVIPLAKKKPWLREQCAWILYRGMHTVASILDQNRGSMIMQSLADNGLLATPEGVALCLTLRKLNPTCSMPKNIFEQQDPLAQPNRKLLVRIMKEDSSKQDDETAEIQTQRGSWSSAPNFAWDVIISSIFDSEYADQFPQFWRELVDGESLLIQRRCGNPELTSAEGIFAASSSPERKLSGFALFASQVKTLPANRLPVLVSRNIVVNMNQQLSTKKGYLHQATNQAVQALLARAEADPEIIQPVLQRLFADDAIMKLALNPNLRPKLTEKLVSCANDEHVEGVLRVTLAPLRLGSSFGRTRSPTQDNLLTLIVTRIRSLPYPSESGRTLNALRQLYNDLLRSLAKAAYFNEDDENPPDHDADDAEFYKTQLTNALANLLIKDTNPSYYYIETAKTIGDLDGAHSGKAMLDEQVRTEVTNAQKRVSKLAKATSQGSPHQSALALLFSLCIIQVYNGDVDSLEALEDLQECYKSIADSEDADEQAKAADAIVDILLSFTAKPATMFKSLAQKAFAMCTDIVTHDGIQSMLEILRSKEDISGQSDLFDQRDDEGSDEDIDGMDDSDVEMIDADQNHESDEDEDEETSSQNGEDDSSDGTESGSGEEDEAIDVEDADDEELMAFDAKLAEALGTRRADTDMAHDEDESSESDMDDDQMEALDEHITTMFKQRKQAENKTKKKEKKEAKETMVVFKTRVLELLKIYINKQHANPLSLELVVPLVELVKNTQNAKVRNETIELLNNLFKRVKLVKKDGAAEKKVKKEARRLLEDVHGLVAAKRSKPLQAACSRASLLLTKVFLSNGGDVQAVVKQYNKTSERVANKPARFREDFFKNWDLWYTSARKDLGK